MIHNAPSKLSRRSYLIALPAIIGLVSASALVGYASNDFLPRKSAPDSLKAIQLSWLNPRHEAAPQDSPANATDENADDPISDYKTALTLLKKYHYGPDIDTKQSRQLTYESIRGMLSSLHDQFTSFLDPDEWSQFHATTKGDFEGIGAFLQQDGPFTKISRPIETSPAEKAGIKSDDVIVSVNGKSVKGKDLNDVVRMIQGKRGTHVLIGIRRGTQTLTFNLVRALVEPPIVQYWLEDKDAKIGHIVLKEFNEKSMEQLDHAYRDLQRQGMRALVFDLRYNPGGLLEVAIQVASSFIPRDSNPALNNVVVYIHEGTGREQARTLIGSEYTHSAIPLAVLVNRNSASASEIVSGAIKDYGIGTLIGERTFGKGKVQTLFPLADNSALRLTTALYFPPKKCDINFKHDEDGNRIEGTGGILPDIEVKQSSKWRAEDFKDKVNDVQLQKALEFLRARLKGQNIAQATNQILKH